MTEKQPEFFPEPEIPATSIDEAVAHIAEHVQPTEYEDRTSEAAEDQGWGPVEIPKVTPTTPNKTEKLYEMPGRNRGRVNSYDQPLTREQAQEGMSEEDIALQGLLNKAGIGIAREALKPKLKPKAPSTDRILGRPGH